MADNSFVGAWALVSFEVRAANGAVTYPFGHDVRGYIMYNQDGYMSVAFMSAGRARCKSEDVRATSVEEKVSAMDSYLSYCGRYEVRGDKVVHHIEVSLFPNWTGQDQERFYKFEGDQLTLSTAPMPIGGMEQTAHLIWKRSLAVRIPSAFQGPQR
jgi:Lipocalin-like domain